MGDDAAGAGEAAARALDLFREHQERGGEAYALRLLGDVEAWRGDAERARLRVGESYDLAERLEMKPLAARCRLWLATARPPDREPGVDTSARLAAVRDLEAMGMDHWARPAGAGPW